MENTRNTTLPIAVIILNWNGKKLLEEFLPSVVENSSRDISRLIVADNGSTDDSVEYIRQNYGDTVETLCFSQNYGFAEGYNKAIAAVDNEYVVLLNSDVAVTPGWD
ncbi:MAG: glycosyltransferase, partial [Muribaculaceae bacterium]|nr:glycosyltransferase [Muribaculaceae bacterium]